MESLPFAGRRAGRKRARLGAVLPATLVVLVLAALAAVGALALADAERASVSTALERSQTRALAWSGVQGAMAELASQRADILGGAAPVLTESWVLFETASGRRAVARLLPIGADGELAVSESAKIDVNSAPAEVLARVPGLGEGSEPGGAAGAIVAAREERAFGSIEELVGVGGLSAAVIHGGAASEDSGSIGRAGAALPLADLLTAWSFDPNVQAGLGARGAGHEGELRVNINTPWSEGLRRAIVRRYDEETAAGVENIMKEGREFKTDADIIATLRFFGVESADWVETLDAFTTCPDPFVAGRVDINLAPQEVLACLPGISPEVAADIVNTRERLDAQTLRSVAWPAIEGLLTTEQFQEAAAHVTIRSAQWRVRVEAGYEAAAADWQGDRPATGAEATQKATGEPLEGRIVLDAVIDIAAERPRLAYLRDCTSLDLALALAAAEEEMAEAPTDEERVIEEDDESAERVDTGDAAEVLPDDQTGTGDASSGDESTSGSSPRAESSSPRVGRSPSESAPEKDSGDGVAPPSGGEDNRRGRWTPRAALKGSGRTGGETGPKPTGLETRPAKTGLETSPTSRGARP